MSSKKKHGRGNRSEDSDYDDDDNNSEYDEVVNARGGNIERTMIFCQRVRECGQITVIGDQGTEIT